MLELPSGVILNLEKISWIARQDLNKYVVFMEGMSPKAPFIDGNDLDVLRGLGLIQKIQTEEPVAANDSAPAPSGIITS